MKKYPLISVVVPIYKVEEYLDRCVSSLVGQSYKNLEIILVDDGSPDNCPQMCEGWADKDNRIKVIHKENGGLSDARNAGLKAVTGDYIGFVDSDDWIDVKTYELVLKKMLDTASDIGAFNILSVTSEEFTPELSDEYEVLDSEKAIENTIDDVGVRTVVWNKLYKRELLDGLPFEKGKLHEDEFFTFRVLDRAERIVYLHRQCYYYFQRPSSIMGVYSPKHIDMLEGVWQRTKFVEKKYPAIYSKAKISFSFCCIHQYCMILKNKKSDPQRSARKKIAQLRSSVKLNKVDVKGQKGYMPFFHRLSNTAVGLDFVCRLMNLAGHL